MQGKFAERLDRRHFYDINAQYAEAMHYPQADHLTTQVLWLHSIALVGLVLLNTYLQMPLILPSPFGWRVISLGEGLIVLVAGLFATLIPFIAYQRLTNHFMWRLIVATCLMVYSYLFVYVSGGAIEMHFHLFIVMAYMAIYADWRISWYMFSLIFISHLVLSMVAPSWLYFYGRNDLSPFVYILFLFVMALFTTVFSRNYRGSVAALVAAKTRNDEFLAIASHELKTPLTSMKGYVEVLQRKSRRQADTQALIFTEKLDDQLNKIIGLVRDLLDISRIQAGKVEFRYEMVSMETLIDMAIEEVQAISHRHRIEVVGNKRVMVRGDRIRLSQLLVNLLSNAIKYSPEAERVVISVHAARDRVVVGVQDFGIGISAVEQTKIFEPYFRGRDQQREDVPGGLGMGLYICDEIVRRHHGKLWVDSVVGSGSTFSFLLPLPRLGEERI